MAQTEEQRKYTDDAMKELMGGQDEETEKQSG